MEIDEEFRPGRWETFPCGHKVRELVEFSEIVQDLRVIHGLDALNEITAPHLCFEEVSDAAGRRSGYSKTRC